MNRIQITPYLFSNSQIEHRTNLGQPERLDETLRIRPYRE